MLPAFFVEDEIRRADGCSSPVALTGARGGTVILTLGITRIVEQESLEVVVSGSVDGRDWSPVVTFPQKFYCGTYSFLVDLNDFPEVAYLRAQWKMNRWSRAGTSPLFGFYVFVDKVGALAAAAH